MKKSEALARLEAIEQAAPYAADPRTATRDLCAVLRDLTAASDDAWEPEAATTEAPATTTTTTE